MDFNEQMKKIINDFKSKPTLLLHCCCAPCTSAVIEKLKVHFDITLFYFNPNIMPTEEWQKRKNEFVKLKAICDFNFICPEQNENDFRKLVSGHETDLEGGARCEICISNRLKKTFQVANENNFDYFCSTLSISPHKNAELINKIGFSLGNKTTKWLPNDFKKDNGFLRSIELCKTLNIYRQTYCGCQLKI